jgi:deazaflavin-dependent oxidoreductase (nitroreductase family)
MRTAVVTHKGHEIHQGQEGVPAIRGRGRALQPVGRFVLHLLEMCMVMCAGAIALGFLFFGTAALLGYTDLLQRAPELSVLVIAISLSLPMAVWMRFRGMAWRPTLEMSGSTMVFGLLLIVAYWTDLVARDSLVEVQTSAACPLMLAVMLLRPRLYSGDHAHRRPVTRDGPFPRSFARSNRVVANPVIRRFAGSIGPLTLVKHRGRKTGRTYTTPVMSFTTHGGLVVGVMYGRRSDWVRNVLAGGAVEVKRRGRTDRYQSARLLGQGEGLHLLPSMLRGTFRLLRVRHFVYLTDLAA